MKYTCRVTKIRSNNNDILGQIGRINDMINTYGDNGLGISTISISANPRGGFNASWSDSNGEGEISINGKDFRKLLTSYSRKISSYRGEFGDAIDAIPEKTNIPVAESMFNRECNEMLVLFNKTNDDKESLDNNAEPVINTDGFTQALNNVISSFGLEELPVIQGRDTAEPLEVKNSDSDNAEINLDTSSDGTLEVGDGQVGFEKVDDTLRIVFKDISVTLERKAVLALRDFVMDMDIDDEKSHGMMDNYDEVETDEEDDDEYDEDDEDDEEDGEDDDEDDEK